MMFIFVMVFLLNQISRIFIWQLNYKLAYWDQMELITIYYILPTKFFKSL